MRSKHQTHVVRIKIRHKSYLGERSAFGIIAVVFGMGACAAGYKQDPIGFVFALIAITSWFGCLFAERLQ